MGLHRRERLTASSLATTAVFAAVLAGCGSAPSQSAAAPPTTKGGALVAPKTDATHDADYLTKLAVADPDLATYATTGGDTATRALLTDGSAFCAFLARDGRIDQALVDTAQGVNSTEATTHLPQTMTTFNSIESVALLTLCPDEQRLLPSDTRARIQALGTQLSGRSGAITGS